MYYHFRKTRNRYLSYPKSTSCDFCDPEEYESRILIKKPHAYIIPNRTFYDQWEMSRVLDHLLLVPRRHVLSLNDLDEAERKDVMDFIAEYEQKGYEIYARSPGSVSRSIPHQHTHLIKTDHRPRRGLLYWHRPYILKLFK